MMKFIMIGAGGAIGAMARYSITCAEFKCTFLPTGTLIINLVGSFLIGLLLGVFEEYAVTPEFRIFLFVGVLGGFTTFSAFALENFNLMKGGQMANAFAYILISNLAGIALVFAGYALARVACGAVK